MTQDLAAELERSRRYVRGFALIRLQCSQTPRSKDAARRRLLRATTSEARNSLAGLVRSVDKVWYRGTNTYILLPESTRDAALRLLSRIHAQAPGFLADAQVFVACFPEDAQTSGLLFACLNDSAHVVPVAALSPAANDNGSLAAALQQGFEASSGDPSPRAANVDVRQSRDISPASMNGGGA